MQRFSLIKMFGGIVLGVLLSVATLYLLLRTLDLDSDWAGIFSSMPLNYIIFLALVLLTAWVADAYRLRELAGTFGVFIPPRLAFSAVVAGNFSINVTPFFMGAGIVHIYVLARKGLNISRATSVVAGGAMISHLLQGTLALIALLYTMISGGDGVAIPTSQPLLLLILLYLTVLVAIGVVIYRVDDPARAFGFLLRFKKLEFIRPRLYDFHSGLNLIVRGDSRRLLRIISYTVVYLGCTYAVIPLILAGLGTPQPLGHVVGFQIILFFAASLAPTPGSSGAIELGAFSLFALIVPMQVIGTFLVWWRMATFYCSLVTGVLPFSYLALSNRWHKPVNNSHGNLV